MSTPCADADRAVRVLGLVVLLGLIGACTQTDSGSETGDETATAQSGTDSAKKVDQVLRTNPRFATLVAALDSTRLDTILSGEGPYTIFAPPDTAFAALPSGTVPSLLRERRDRLRVILQHHIVNKRIRAEDLPRGSALPTLSGDSVGVWVTDSTLGVGSTQVLERNLEGTNGVIHVIDRVLRPPISDQN